MRRYLFILLFFARPRGAVRAAAGSRDVGRRGPPARRAPAAYAPRLIILTPHNQDIRREFAAAFARWHQARLRHAGRRWTTGRSAGPTTSSGSSSRCTAPYRNAGRLAQARGRRAHRRRRRLGRRGLLLQHGAEARPRHPPAAAACPKSLLDRGLSRSRRSAASGCTTPTSDAAGNPAPRWVGVCLSSFGICYNADLYDRLGMHRTARDVARPDRRAAGRHARPGRPDAQRVGRGRVQHGHPARDGRRRGGVPQDHRRPGRPAAAGRTKLDKKDPQRTRPRSPTGWHGGMGDLLLIAANGRYFTDSSTQVPNDVGNGQAAAGVVIDFYGRCSRNSSARGGASSSRRRPRPRSRPTRSRSSYGVAGRAADDSRRTSSSSS